MLKIAGSFSRSLVSTPAALGVALLLGIVLSQLSSAEPVWAARMPRSPEGQLLVVTTNLKEVFDAADVADPTDMRVYTRRLIGHVPMAPDVVLLQEVRRSSARRVAALLGDRTGHRYVVAVAPGKVPWTETDDKVVDRETAILVNATTMKAVSDPAHIVTRYPADVAAAGEKPRVRHNSLISVREIRGGATFSLASVHLVQNAFFASEHVGGLYKKRWARQIAEALSAAARSVGGAARAVGGDFNASRGVRSATGKFSYSPFLLTLTGQPYDYTDSVWSVTKHGGPDYIFTTGEVVDAGYDSNYDHDVSNQKTYYSDHRFRWALVAE